MTELLEQIKNDHAKQYNCDFEGIKHCLIEYDLDEIATRYATEVAKRSLGKAAQNAIIKGCAGRNEHGVLMDWKEVDKRSITDESNISL